jgi:L-alanine-DL-glutamate epimerase-like enolase superfamily enzyme
MARITTVELGRVEAQRPRAAGCNARLGVHGRTVHLPIARLTTSDGGRGFGYSRATAEQAAAVVGLPLDAVFDPSAGACGAGLPFDFALWDLAGHHANQPVHALVALAAGHTPQAKMRARCYDTSLYFDDIDLDDDDAAAEHMADEARQGFARGHRAFKIKVGRGARHMPIEPGLRRDVAVVRAVRKAVGPDAVIMLDANNGYTLNLAKHVLEQTAECRVHWLEEAFHEDHTLYLDLREWLRARGLAVLIADGEGEASPSLLDWAHDGVIDVVQYDIFDRGITGWLALGRRLDAWGVGSAPHHYGGLFGNYAAPHLAAAIAGFALAEWDEATTSALRAPGYVIDEGWIHLPDAPGFGLELDEAASLRAVAEYG